MGTTLTGTTPQDTYDSLIKVTDNGPLSGTAKYLSDGLGNDSVLALSTSRVGVGTATPNQPLTIGATNGYPVIDFENSNTAYGDVGFQVDKMVLSAYTTTPLTFWTNSNERMRITSAGEVLVNRSSASGLGKFNVEGGADFTGGNVLMCRDTGNVGIGTSSPSAKLTISTGSAGVMASFTDAVAQTLSILTGSGFSAINNPSGGDVAIQTSNVERFRVTANGVTFNGDTAAANALDDYEEGTWTMGVSFGNASVGITYGVNTGTYTKIGRQVTVNGYLALSNKGSSTGTARITGLPFTIASGDSNYAGVTFAELAFITRTGNISGYGNVGLTNIFLLETSTLGVISALTDANFANNSTIMVSFTYFV